MVLDHWSNDAMVSMDRCGLNKIIACFYACYEATCYDDDDNDDAGDEESLMMGNSLMSQRRTIGV